MHVMHNAYIIANHLANAHRHSYLTVRPEEGCHGAKHVFSLFALNISLQIELPTLLTSLQEGLEFHVHDWQFALLQALRHLDPTREEFREAHTTAV